MQVGLSLLAASFVAGAILLILITANEAAETSNQEAANSGSIYTYEYSKKIRKHASHFHY